MSTEEASAVSELHSPSVRVSIVGVGGAGNNLVGHGISRGIDPNDCVVVSSDTGQLSRSLAPNKVFLGETSWDSKNPSGQSTRLLQSSAHRVTPFTEDSDFTILVAGLGGATATATAPLIAQYNRTLVKPVVSIITIPFIHERERRFVALRGLKKMVESCDCTIVVDNAMEQESFEPSDRVADTTASVAMHILSRIVLTGDRRLTQRILDNLSVGDIAILCTATWSHRDTVQSAVFAALRTPSAKMALARAKGAVLIYSGSSEITTTQAAKAYETIVSLIGHDVTFVYGSITKQAESRVSIFLSGFTYDAILGAFVDFIEDLYDLEYGQESSEASIPLRIPLFEMEQA